MKTFEWNDVRQKKPETKDGISELLIAKTNKNNPIGKRRYEYVLCVYNAAEKCFVIIGNSILNIPENEICIDWKDVYEWSYIPCIEDVGELRYKINKIAKYIDKYTNECQECPVLRECKKDAEELPCKEHIVKYLSGD